MKISVYLQLDLMSTNAFFLLCKGSIEADVTAIMQTSLRTVIQSVIGMDHSSTLVVSAVMGRVVSSHSGL